MPLFSTHLCPRSHTRFFEGTETFVRSRWVIFSSNPRFPCAFNITILAHDNLTCHPRPSKSRESCNYNASCETQKTQGSSKRFTGGYPRDPPARAQDTPEGPQATQRTSKASPRIPKATPRRPKGPQWTPRSPQDTPGKGPQRDLPGHPRDLPGHLAGDTQGTLSTCPRHPRGSLSDRSPRGRQGAAEEPPRGRRGGGGRVSLSKS